MIRVKEIVAYEWPKDILFHNKHFVLDLRRLLLLAIKKTSTSARIMSHFTLISFYVFKYKHIIWKIRSVIYDSQLG